VQDPYSHRPHRQEPGIQIVQYPTVPLSRSRDGIHKLVDIETACDIAERLSDPLKRASAESIAARAKAGALDLERIAAFIRGYHARRSISDAQLADAAHRRWWDLVVGVLDVVQR
jgi:hypothetical protein